MNEENNNTAILVQVTSQQESQFDIDNQLRELSELCANIGLKTLDTRIIVLREINPATMISKGKVAELKELAGSLECSAVVFNCAVSPTVQRNLERELDVSVIDRIEVILEIFAQRAVTSEARDQVELARLTYSLPRLARKVTNLSQQRGTVKGSKGSGETQLELDRRKAATRIMILKKNIEKTKRSRDVQRKSRLRNQVPTVAIVGYTNSGKSSLLNLLTQSDALAQDKLFATLDTTTRKARLPGGMNIIFTDTVGFVSNLPHFLIDAFSSTLEEARLADLLIVLCDAQSPDLFEGYDTTLEVLEQLGCLDTPRILAMNKIDTLKDSPNLSASRFMNEHPEILKISAKDNIGIDSLKAQVEKELLRDYRWMRLEIPASRQDIVAQAKAGMSSPSIEYKDQSVIISGLGPESLMTSLKPWLK